MKDPLGVNPSKGNQGTTRGKEKILLTLVGIEPTTSGLDLPLLCRLNYEVGPAEISQILVINRVRVSRSGPHTPTQFFLEPVTPAPRG